MNHEAAEVNRLSQASNSPSKLRGALEVQSITMPYSSGRQFLQIPGPTNVPDRVLRAIARPTIDHRGPEFSRLTGEVLEGLKGIFKTSSKVVIFA